MCRVSWEPVTMNISPSSVLLTNDQVDVYHDRCIMKDVWHIRIMTSPCVGWGNDQNHNTGRGNHLPWVTARFSTSQINGHTLVYYWYKHAVLIDSLLERGPGKWPSTLSSAIATWRYGMTLIKSSDVNVGQVW